MFAQSKLATKTQTIDKSSDDYKARKYHHKIQTTLHRIMAGGKPCPQGYEKYLKPYNQI
jgi:hypothetical protein